MCAQLALVASTSSGASHAHQMVNANEVTRPCVTSCHVYAVPLTAEASSTPRISLHSHRQAWSRPKPLPMAGLHLPHSRRQEPLLLLCRFQDLHGKTGTSQSGVRDTECRDGSGGCGAAHLEGAHQRLVNAHHGTRVVKFATVVRSAEDCDELPLCKELVAVLNNLQRRQACIPLSSFWRPSRVAPWQGSR